MDFPIYVVGDGHVFYSMLNAIAMIFNSSAFWNSVFLLSGLSMLIGIGYKMVAVSGGDSASSGAFGISAPMAFAAIVALIGIRTDVVVQDIYSGNIYKVSNIPIVVSAPASAFTSAYYKLFQAIDTAYSVPSATTSLSVGSVGFMNPLRMLLALREGIEGGVDPNARKTLDEYVVYCGESTSLDAQQVAKVSKIALLQYLQKNAFQGGLTNIYNEANPSGLPGTCRQTADYLLNYFQTQVANPRTSPYLAAILNVRMKEKNPTNSTGGGAWTGLAGAEAVLNIGDVAGSAQSAQVFAINALTFNTITLAFECRHKRVFESAYSTCVADLARASAQEQWKTSESFAASFFMGTAILTQTAMQVLFFGLSPIILIYMLFAGASGFKLYWNYLCFGVWTSSFLVFTAIIQGLIMMGLQSRAAAYLGRGLTLETWSEMYNSLTFWLAAGSSLMAAVPLLSYGLLKGGGAAYTAISSRMNGERHVDASKVSPDAIKYGSMATTAPGAIANLGSGVGQSSTAAAISVGTSNKVSQVDSQALQNSLSQSWGKSWKADKTETDSAGTKFTATTDGIEYGKSNQQSAKLTKEQSAQIAAEMGGGTPEAFPVKFKAAFKAATSRDASSEDQAAFNMSQRIGWTSSTEAGHSSSLIGSLTESEQQSVGRQMTAATQKARTQESTISQNYDLHGLVGLRSANPQAYDRQIAEQDLLMGRVPGYAQALQKADQNLRGYQMDDATRAAMVKTVAIANTQSGGVDISGLKRPDASEVNTTRPNTNPGTTLSSGAQATAKGKVEAGAADLKNQSASDRKNLEPASGAMAAGVVADGVSNTGAALVNASSPGATPIKTNDIGNTTTSPEDMNYGPDGAPVGASSAQVKAGVRSTPAPGAQVNASSDGAPVQVQNTQVSQAPTSVDKTSDKK